MKSSTVKVSGTNNIRLPAPLTTPYPNDQVDIQKYLGEHCQEGQVIQPGNEIVPHNLSEMVTNQQFKS
ncbi:MAG: hypothetical protein AAFO58_12950 [Pseudomonadota bacterium]